MSFYVTLPSDSSMHFFPENKISHFKTQLPSPVCLNGEWEVGLSEIIYPHSWLNVNETNNYFLYKVGDGNISSTVKRIIDVGCYETMLDIISAVQLALPKNPNRFTIIYYKATKRVKINAVQGSSLHLENLGELLGSKRSAIIIGNMKSEFVADAWSNFSVFYVYSDLISPQRKIISPGGKSIFVACEKCMLILCFLRISVHTQLCVTRDRDIIVHNESVGKKGERALRHTYLEMDRKFERVLLTFTEKFLSVRATYRYPGKPEDIGYRPCNFEPRSRKEDDTLSAPLLQTSTPLYREDFEFDRFNVHQPPLHGESSVEPELL
ncbi:uncharacterized protein TNCV_1607371 [Trichonephila clavipes]|nr:uncharacterized protein TNCV_1607371 [Trichonephila clavipes]